MDNYKEFYINIIHYLKTSNSLLTIPDNTVVKFKQHWGELAEW